MKQPYSKPIIATGEFRLDLPIAYGCTAKKDDILGLMDLGYFTSDRSCSLILGEGPVGLPGYDTICYHGNVQTAFLS